VNIAAEQVVYGHFQNRFALDYGVHMGLAHADDPYGIHHAPEIPIEDILLDDPTFQAWFVNEPDLEEQGKNVSRRVADLYLQYLPEYLLMLHCWDTLLGNDHASSKVYDYVFKSTYSVAEMEAMGLWTAMDAKLAQIGGCAAV
jgi:hypothetical protein